MRQALANDLDYLATRLHARRSRMAEGARLDELSHLRSVPELTHALLPGLEFASPGAFQRRLVEDLAAEISGCLKHLEGGTHEFIAWLLVRLQLENAKVLLRGFLNHTPPEALQAWLVALPSGLHWDAPGLMESKSLAEFIARMPSDGPRQRLQAMAAHEREATPFLLEGALDSGYFEGLLARASRLDAGEAAIAKPMVAQEVNQFQFLLVLRGRFYFGLSAEALSGLRMAGSHGGGGWWEQLLSAPDPMAAATSGVGTVIDALPVNWRPAETTSRPDVSVLERLAWQRYLRLANTAFRRSHMGAAAMAAYFNLRRLEIANLITLSEGIRLGLEERDSRSRLILRTDGEVSHV